MIQLVASVLAGLVVGLACKDAGAGLVIMIVVACLVELLKEYT